VIDTGGHERGLVELAVPAIPEYPLREQAISVVNRRIGTVSEAWSKDFPVLRFGRQCEVFFDLDIVIVSCASYTSQRKIKERVASFQGLFPGLYSNSSEDANLILREGAFNNGIIKSKIENPVGPAITINKDVTFALCNVLINTIHPDNGRNYRYNIDMVFLIRLGKRITRLTFQHHLEALIVSFLEVIRLRRNGK
jgi:hypothetical protein